MEYSINGVPFTEAEIRLLHTLRNMLDHSTEPSSREFQCDLCESQHMRVLQEQAAWFLAHEEPTNKEEKEEWLEECIDALAESAERHGVSESRDLFLMWRVMDGYDFRLLETPLQRHMVRSLPVDCEELLALFRQEGEELELDQEVAGHIIELARVLPNSADLQKAKLFLEALPLSPTQPHTKRVKTSHYQ